MRRDAQWLLLLALAMGSGPTFADTGDLTLAAELQQSYDRCASRIMVRIIPRADRAALDHAAYDRNPLFHYPLQDALSPPAALALKELSFGGALVRDTICDRIGDTPLTEQEIARPLAWRQGPNHPS